MDLDGILIQILERKRILESVLPLSFIAGSQQIMSSIYRYMRWFFDKDFWTDCRKNFLKTTWKCPVLAIRCWRSSQSPKQGVLWSPLHDGNQKVHNVKIPYFFMMQNLKKWFWWWQWWWCKESLKIEIIQSICWMFFKVVSFCTLPRFIVWPHSTNSYFMILYFYFSNIKNTAGDSANFTPARSIASLTDWKEE